MRTLRLWLGLLGALALVSLARPASAQPVGSEFQINTYTTGDQGTITLGGGHLIASSASGNFVVVWGGEGQGDRFEGIFGQRFDSFGGPLGTEFRVNSHTTNSQETPSVAAASSGDFVVVWQSLAQDGSSYGIFGQRYDSGGVPQGTEFRVNSYTASDQKFPSVASDASGNFVVVWEGQGQGDNHGIFGQRYDSGGAPRGAEFRVNSHTAAAQDVPSVASDASGNFVVVWQGFGRDRGYFDIFGQRYDSAGVAQGDEFRITSYTPMRSHRLPSVASDANGNFVVAWALVGLYGGEAILGQRYDNAGVALGEKFQINSFRNGYLGSPSVAADASGNFVVVWDDRDVDSYGVFGQRYDSAGVAQGDEFQINTFTTDTQRFPSVGATSTNQFVVAWESAGQDGSGDGVFGQRFDFAGDTIRVVSPNANVKWRIGSQQRIQWTHNLGANATFRIELDRDDDGGYEELIAAAAPVDSATKGSFAWTVTGPPSGTARVRVSWTDDPSVSDSSDVTFQIRPVGLD